MAYGGYTKSNYGAQGGEDGGGFLGGSQQQGSQGGGGKSYGDETLRPLTIKQLTDWEEAFPGADVTIDGMPLTQLTIVGQVRAVNPQTTNVTYRLDDGTGTIDVKDWVDPEALEDSGPRFSQDQYVRVFGRLRSFNGKKHVGALFMRVIEDFNEVNYHLVEAAYVHLYLTKGPPGQQQAQGGDSGGNNAGGDSMFVDGYGAGGTGAGGGQSRTARCSRNAQTMYNFLQNTPGGNEGVHLNVIASGTGLGVRDVIGAADELLGEGLVYTTIDDETWAILEAYS